jgi:hypothetical protein
LIPLAQNKVGKISNDRLNDNWNFRRVVLAIGIQRDNDVSTRRPKT